jgi:tetratricopeptide (TPR) repeat protein
MKIKWIAANLVLAAALVIVLAPSAFAQEPEHQHHHDGAENLGTVNFPVSCAPAVQPAFNRAMALLYSFEYESSLQAFERISASDSKCVMAYWGRAMSLYHQLWERPSKDTVRNGAEYLRKAKALKAPTAREQEYIGALAIFYSDSDKLDHDKRARAYCDAMRKVYEHNPQDREAAVLYALSLLGSADQNDPEHTNDKAAVAILTKLFDEQPTHPGIAHYIIHSCDNPSMASLGLTAARKYASIAPASAHAVHMPSHIFARLGLWQDDIQSNVAAIQIADKMIDMKLHVMHHRLHSMDFLEYAYLQIGDDANAKAQVTAIEKIRQADVDPDFQDYFEAHRASFPAVYLIERRQWKETLQLQPEKDAVPGAQSIAFWAQAIAAGHLHNAAAANDALKHFDELVEATRKGAKPYTAEYLKNNREEVQAWADYASGKPQEAVKRMRSVADTQDRVGKGETELPAREMLADMLLESGKAQEALEQYEIALKTDPNRFNGLYGAAQAAGQVQQKEKAASYYAQLLKNCSGSQSDRPELQQAKMLVVAK